MPFQLEDTEAAIIFTEESIKIALPKQDDDEIVPAHVRDCVGLAALWRKDDTRLILMDMIDKLFEEFINAEEQPEEDEINTNEGC